LAFVQAGIFLATPENKYNVIMVGLSNGGINYSASNKTK
jgi:hypothetical protein